MCLEIELRKAFKSKWSPIVFDLMRQAVSERLLGITKDGILKRFLNDLIKDRVRVEGLAKESYSHPNGFDRLVLAAPISNDFRLRMHVWHPRWDSEHRDANLHNHTRDIWSIVLKGELCDSTYVEARSAAEYYRYVVGERAGKESYHIEPCGKANLSKQTGARVSTGEVYSLPFFTVHRTSIPKGLQAITLFLQGPLRQGASIVYSSEPLEMQRNEASGSYTTDEYITKLQQAMAMF